ncbi:MAG: hypothetical protein ACJAUG_000397 [Halioglobus sp.]|jgi:hypothetical protein
MHCVQTAADGVLRDDRGIEYQLCANRKNYQVCNGLVPLTGQSGPHLLCSTCELNRTIPIVERPENLLRWQRLEDAKRRMIAGLAALGLQVGKGNNNSSGPMRFDFMEDQRSHPDVLEEFVSTGHENGLITINLMEADEVKRVQQREWAGERQRTLLGHFRHESGHYFFEQLIGDGVEFSRLFGDQRAPYGQALSRYYENGPVSNWGLNFISAYASSHPMEDWAECFAHVLHIHDALETATAYGLFKAQTGDGEWVESLEQWGNLVVALNEINRSLGVRDPYPFFLNDTVMAKMNFIKQTIAKLTVDRV